jgi:hypothetical protein
MHHSDSQQPVPMSDTPDSPHARESVESILRRARERVNGGRDSEAAPDETLPWVHDSWIGECEAAGVYSCKAPAFDDLEGPSITVTLTRAELVLLAQRHLNTVAKWREWFTWTGMCERDIEERVMCHDIRFHQLAELLPVEDQQRFRHQIEIRNRYIASVGAEVFRCEKAESKFWARADAGLVREAEEASHNTPPFVAGLPVTPAPADGGPEPEQWSLFP